MIKKTQLKNLKKSVKKTGTKVQAQYSDRSTSDTESMTPDMKRLFIHLVMKLREDTKKEDKYFKTFSKNYNRNIVEEWFNQDNKVMKIEERFGSSIQVVFEAGNISFFSWITISDQTLMKVLKQVCELLGSMNVTLKYDTYDIAWLFFKSQRKQTELKNYPQNFNNVIIANTNDLEVTCWQKNRDYLIKSIEKLGQLKNLKSLNIDNSLICTNENKDFAFLERLLEALNNHINDIKSLQSFKLTIKILQLKEKLFKNSPNLLTLLRTLQTKTSKKDSEFKAVIEHEKYGKDEKIILAFPLEQEKWKTLENQLIKSEEFQIQ